MPILIEHQMTQNQTHNKEEGDEQVRHLQIRIPDSKFMALQHLKTLRRQNMQELMESIVDDALAKPDAKKVRELAGLRGDNEERVAYFMDKASKNYKEAVLRIIDAWYETESIRRK